MQEILSGGCFAVCFLLVSKITSVIGTIFAVKSQLCFGALKCITEASVT